MNKLLITASLLALFATAPAQADKPSWAGQGGKPSEAERASHKDAMTSKGGAKNNTKGMQHKGEQHKGEHDMDDPKHEADRMQRQSPVENAHEAVHDAAQVQDTAKTIKKWYEFWKN